ERAETHNPTTRRNRGVRLRNRLALSILEVLGRITGLQPLISTLFPYTTLFRSVVIPVAAVIVVGAAPVGRPCRIGAGVGIGVAVLVEPARRVHPGEIDGSRVVLAVGHAVTVIAEQLAARV